MEGESGKVAQQTTKDYCWLRRCLRLARYAAQQGEVPVGAIVIGPQGQVLGVGYNRRERERSPLAHAEMIAIQRAARRLGNWRLIDCTLYVSIEPCIMCAGSILQARLRRLVFGSLDPKGGGVHSLYQLLNDARLNHQVREVIYLPERECGQIVTDFFRERRRRR